ncbi:MAG: DUF5694 domain-containing protein [Caulobacteraceae bacterium]
MRTILLGLLLACASPALAATAPAEPVEVMIVGDFHMANPGRDLHNVQVPDVLTPKYQAQIAAVDAALAHFHPTVVAAEWSAKTVDERYPKYLAGTLAPSPNEVVQLGFRLARATGASMHGIDVQGAFPYEAVEAYAKAHGEEPVLDAAGAKIQAMVDTLTRLIDTRGVVATLRYLNDPARLAKDNDFYRDMLKIGGGEDQPGAALLTAWYGRNFRICANLIQLARPGDRMVVFYGSGHAFLLRQCVAETPGFKLVEPDTWLK